MYQKFCQKWQIHLGVTVIQVGQFHKGTGFWVSNRVSWLDIPVVGSVAPVFSCLRLGLVNGEFWTLEQAGGTLLFSEAQEMWVRW